MSVIKPHGYTLSGSFGGQSLMLRPLSDEHLPLLYKWESDPELLYWSEGGEDKPLSYPPEAVRKKYSAVSKTALNFIVELGGRPIGNCWLQKMNLPEVKSMYPVGTDVRRIDMEIGEKEYWGKGIGTAFVRMLVKFAFEEQPTDVLHCFCEDYNIRSRRVWEKLGFKLILTEALPQPQKGRFQYHWRLTREEYMNKF